MFSLMAFRSKRSTSSSRAGGYGSVAVRFAGPEDEAAIRRVAALDNKGAPTALSSRRSPRAEAPRSSRFAPN
jgi:hypothetical protein